MLSYLLLAVFPAAYLLGLDMGDHYELAVRRWFAPRGLTTLDRERLGTRVQGASLDTCPVSVTVAA